MGAGVRARAAAGEVKLVGVKVVEGATAVVGAVVA